MSLNREIYPNLKLRIYTAGIRQNRLAKMVGIDEAYLSKIINGFREPSGSLRELIARALKSDPEWLFRKIQVSTELIPDRLDDQFDHRLDGRVASPTED